ncbi:LysR family transcriptional regulator [uncultured Marinobacter sp.]|uniref:LysR family transcriptional regulator n=1 Tax=uncultured Marinobacter sp. TaxID=187379 RepID=UPI0030DC9F4B
MHNTRFLRYIDTVARTGSIRKAAEQLNVVSSAVNRRILDIEAEIGTPLFERRARGVRLTAAGELFVAYARKQLAELEHTLSEIEDLSNLRRGLVSVAAIEGMAADLLPGAIQAFQQTHPNIRFRVLICGRDEVLGHLKEFRADIGLVFNPPPDPEIRALMEIEQKLCAFVSPDHPLAGRDAVRLSECVEYPLAIPDTSLGGRGLLDEFLARRSLRLQPALESNSFEMMRNFAIKTGGVCFQIQNGMPPSRMPGGMHALNLSDRGLRHGRLVLCTEHGRALPVATARFVEHLKGVLEDAR